MPAVRVADSFWIRRIRTGMAAGTRESPTPQVLSEYRGRLSRPAIQLIFIWQLSSNASHDTTFPKGH
jgi:hypothetical protein